MDSAPGGSSDAAQIVYAAGAGVAAVLGALALFRRRHVEDEDDPADRPGAIRERVARTEVRLDHVEPRVDELAGEVSRFRRLLGRRRSDVA